MIQVFLRKLRGFLCQVAVRLVTGGRIESKKVVFNQTDGNGFGCNPKAVALEILRRHSDWDLVWLCRNPTAARTELPPGIRAVPFFSFAALRELASAKVWFSNQFFRHHTAHCGLAKRPGQFYIQTWHGGIGIKTAHSGARWEAAHPESVGNDFKRRESAMMDVIVTSSAWTDTAFQDIFYGYGRYLRVGYPRNDLFFDAARQQEATTRVRQTFALAPEEKVILYVPTLRANKRWNGYLNDYAAIERAVAARFGGTWRMMVRLHPVLLHKKGAASLATGAIDAGRYPDIQELLAAADILISDYSSCMYDFMLQRRPVFAYVPDLHDYEESGDLLYPLETTPFPISRNLAELEQTIHNFNDEVYRSGVERFLTDFGCVENGTASAQVVDVMEGMVKS